MASLRKQDYERALSQATGEPVVLDDNDYQRLLKGQKLSESALNAAKVRGKNAGDDFAEPDGQPLLTPDKPAETYKPVVKGPNAPASSTVGKIQMPGMAPPIDPRTGRPLVPSIGGMNPANAAAIQAAQ